jgi:hypothetical protein
MFHLKKKSPLLRADLKIFQASKGNVAVRMKTIQGDWYAGLASRIGILQNCFYISFRPLAHYHHYQNIRNMSPTSSVAPLFKADDEPVIHQINRTYPILFGTATKINHHTEEPLLEIESNTGELITLSTRPVDLAQVRALLRTSASVT